MRLQKRGDGGVSFPLEHLVGLALAVFIIILIAPPIVSFFSSLLGGGNEQETMNNFMMLAKVAKINTEGMLAPALPFYISKNFIVVAFNKNNEGSADNCQYETVPRPSSISCQNAACLCLYKEQSSDDDFANNIPIACEKVNDVDEIFTLDYYDSVPEKGSIKYTEKEEIYKNIIGPRIEVKSQFYNDQYARLFIYGQCEDWTSDINFGIQRLYIEKMHDQEKAYLFIADYANSVKYQDRLKTKNEPQA